MIDPQPVFAETSRLYRRSPRGSRGAVWERRGIEFVMEDVARRKAMRSVLVVHRLRKAGGAFSPSPISPLNEENCDAGCEGSPNTVRAKKCAPRDSWWL